MVKKSKRMTDDDVQRLAESEIALAKKYTDERSNRRQEAWNRYYGCKLGNEKKGRSQFITRELMDTIEWMMPYLIRTFAAGDPKIEIEIMGQPSWVGKGIMEKIQTDLSDSSPSQFTLFYQWFKDGLVSDTSFVKLSWHLDQQTVTIDIDAVTPENMQVLASDPDAEIVSAEQATGPFGQIMYQNVTAKIKKTIADTLHVENTPHWEFLTVKDARDVNDEHPKGHRTEVTLDYLKRINRAMSPDGKKPFFKHLDELEKTEERGVAPSSTNAELDAKKPQYMEGTHDTSTEPEYSGAQKGAKAPIKLTEWFTRLDVDGDGYLENIVCWMGNDKLLRWEKNREGMIAFCALKPIIDPYKFYGISYADLLIEVQNLKTVLFRRILDNFDFQNSGRWRVDPGGGVDLSSLLNSAPGRAVFAKKDAVEDLTPRAFQPGSLSILEYVDTIKENRTGVSRQSQGMNTDSLNRTATGVVQLQSAAMQRMELIARIFAETGLKDFYRKCAMLYQRHLRKPFIAKVQGTERQIDRRMIQGKVVCRVNMGVEAAIGVQEAEKIERMLGVLFKINELFPGLLTPEKVHNLAKRYVTSLGFKQADDFVSEMRQYVQTHTQMQQNQADMQKRMMELETQLKQFEMTSEAQKLRDKKQIEADKVALKERDSIRDHKVGMLTAIGQLQSAQIAARGQQNG